MNIAHSGLTERDPVLSCASNRFFSDVVIQPLRTSLHSAHPHPPHFVTEADINPKEAGNQEYEREPSQNVTLSEETQRFCFICSLNFGGKLCGVYVIRQRSENDGEAAAYYIKH